MRIQTSNRLAHLQIELNELCEQTQMLQAQLPVLQNQIVILNQYLAVNNGDKAAHRQRSQLQQQYNHICATIRRNSMKIAALQRQIEIQSNNIAKQIARENQQTTRGRNKGYANKYSF